MGYSWCHPEGIWGFNGHDLQEPAEPAGLMNGDKNKIYMVKGGGYL